MSWRSYQSLTEGEMLINGTVRGNILEFGFNDHYFFCFLHKPFGDGKQTTGVGPYFTVSLDLINLLVALSPSDLCSPEGKTHSFEGPNIGKMEINWGRMAADEGEITRNIEQLKLSLIGDVDGFLISLIGDTGPVDPTSTLDQSPEYMRPCHFQVSYRLRRDHIERMLADHPLQAKLMRQFQRDAL